MNQIKALLIKFVMIAVILSFVLGLLTDLSFRNILYLSIAVTVIAYVLGDMLLLSVANNTVTTIVDVGIVFLNVYLYNYLIDAELISGWDALLAAVLIGVGEWFFHKYVARNVLEKDL